MTTPKAAERASLALVGGEARPNGQKSAEPRTKFSDTDLAELFVARHRDEYRYTAVGGAWRRLEGSVWERDRTLAIYDQVRRMCREIAATVDSQTEAKSITSKVTVANVEFLARSHSDMAATPEQWDADPDLLAVPGGVVDLRTQSLRAARGSDYCTRSAAVAPKATGCRRWLEFLQWATKGDDDLIAYLQRVMGYSLTGHIREHAILFVFGPGGNGKTVFASTWQNILGGYATPVPIATFTASRYDRHPTELAMLQGHRLVTANETESGRRWAEARLKELTGGGRITARFMRGDFFSFQPAFKMVVVGNHRPHFTQVDDAIRRRLHLAPFDAKLAEGRKDPLLEERLREEWPGILEWMIEGCAEWLDRGGLHAPEAILAATSDYLANEDPFADFLDEQCELRPLATVTSAALSTAWSAWAQRNRIPAGDYRDLAQRLLQHGVKAKRLGERSVRGYEGIELRFPNPDDNR